MDPTNVTLLKQKQDLLNKSVDNCKEKLEKLKATQTEVQTKFEKYQQVKPILESLTKEISGTEKELKKLREQQEKARKALEDGKIGKEQYDKIADSVQQCEKNLVSLKKEQNELSKSVVNNEQYRDFQREIVATETKLKSLEKQAKNFGSVGAQQVAVVGEKIENIGDNITSAGKKMLGVTATITATGAAAIAVGSSFDSAMKQVAATMGITVDEINNGSESYKILEEAAQKCGETTKFSASESAEALNYLALAGYDAQKSAETLPKVLNLAAAGGLDLATASDMVTDAMSALGLETKNLDTYIDEMAKTSQKSNTSVFQLGEATLTCAGTVKNAHMSIETMNAELGILADNGLKGAEGGTHLRNIILSLTSPTDQAAKTMKSLGIEIFDSQGNIRDFNTILSEMDDKLSNLNDDKKGETLSNIFNKTDLNAVNYLLEGTNGRFEELTKELSNCSGAAANMADTMNSSLSGQITLLKSQLEGIGIKLSNILMPILKSIIEKISSLLDWVSKLNPTAQKIIVVIAAVVAAIGPLLITVGKLVSSIGTIMVHGPMIASVFGAIKTAVTGLFSVLAANPIVLVIMAIIAAVVLLWNKCEWFRNLVIAVFEVIKNAVMKLWENIKAIWDFVYPYFMALWESIKTSVQPLIEAIAGAFSAIWEFIKVIWDKVQPYFATIWENIKIIFSVVGTVLGTYFSIAWEVIKAIWDLVYPYFQMIWENIKVVFSVVSTTLGGFFETAWTIIKAVWDNVIGYFTVIWQTIEGIFSVVTAVFQGDFEGAWQAIKGIVDAWASYFQNIWDNIKAVFSSVVDFFSNSFQAAWDGIKNIFGNVGNFFQSIWDNIKNIFSNVGTAIGNAIGDAFRSVVNAIISFAENNINSLIRSINSAINIINAIPGVNIPNINELNIPRLKIGMANVPYDDYLAYLHKGERVLTAEENREYSNRLDKEPRGNNIDNSFNLTINSPKQTSPAENARLLRKEIQKYRLLRT